MLNLNYKELIMVLDS